MQRTLIGILGVVGILVTATMFLTDNMSDNRGMLIGSACFRCGILLCLACLSYPQIKSLAGWMPKWAWGMVLLAVFLTVIRPKLFPLSLVIIAIIGAMQFISWLFKPPPGATKRKSKRQDGA